MAGKDSFSRAERSAIMRAVRGSGTTAETKMLALLASVSNDLWRRQADDVPGRPDFVCDALRVAVFVDGDFWHGRWWRESGAAPVANREYWVAKLERNWNRDRLVERKLRRAGWCVVRVWESELRKPETAVRVRRAIGRRRRACVVTGEALLSATPRPSRRSRHAGR